MSPPAESIKITRLSVTDGKGFEKVVLIGSDPFPIGSDAADGLTLEGGDPSTIAARHAIIRREGQEYLLVDQSGPCGTRVNGRPIRRTVLKDGDQITLGSSPYKIHFLVEGKRATDFQKNKIKIMLHELKELHACLSRDEICTKAVAVIMHVLGPGWSSVALTEAQGRAGGLRQIASGDGSGKLPPLPTGIAQQVVSRSRSFFQPLRLCAPIPGDLEPVGAIDIGPRGEGNYDASDMELLEALAAHVGVALANTARVGRADLVSRDAQPA